MPGQSDNLTISHVSFQTKQRQATCNNPPVTCVGKLDLKKPHAVKTSCFFDSSCYGTHIEPQLQQKKLMQRKQAVF